MTTTTTTSTQEAARAPRGVFGNGAWRIGRIKGIEIAIDPSWLLVFLLITLSLANRFGLENEGWSAGKRWGAALLTSPIFFISILLHELGHSLMALRLGVSVRSITLFIFGGVAQLESEPQRPRDEVLIALAGPAVSVGLGVAFLGFASLFPGTEVVGAAFGWLGTINLALAAFNTVPGYPLDGGRVLRGLLWAITGDFARATRIAARVGSAVAFALIGLGIVTALFAGQWIGGLWLAFIGWFLLSAARASAGQLILEQVLGGVRVRQMMGSVDEHCLSGTESVQEVVEALVLHRGLRTLFVVGAQGELLGLLTLHELARVPVEERPLRAVRELMIPVERLHQVDPGDTLWLAFRRMAAHSVNQLPVIDAGRLVGVLTREQLVNAVQAHLALQGSS